MLDVGAAILLEELLDKTASLSVRNRLNALAWVPPLVSGNPALQELADVIGKILQGHSNLTRLSDVDKIGSEEQIDSPRQNSRWALWNLVLKPFLQLPDGKSACVLTEFCILLMNTEALCATNPYLAEEVGIISDLHQAIDELGMLESSIRCAARGDRPTLITLRTSNRAEAA